MAYKIKGSFNRPLKMSTLDNITVNDNSFQNWIKSNVLPKGIAKTLAWNWYGIDPTKVINFHENLSNVIFPDHQWGALAYQGTPPWNPVGQPYQPKNGLSPRPRLEQLGKTALKGYSAIHNMASVAYSTTEGAAPINLFTANIASEYVDLVGTAEYTDSFDGKGYDIVSLYTNFDTASNEFYSTYSNILVTAFCDWTYKNIIQEWDDNWQLPNPTKTYGAYANLGNSIWSASDNLRTNHLLPGIWTDEGDTGYDIVNLPPDLFTPGSSGDTINEATSEAFQVIMDYLGISENMEFPEWDSTSFQPGFGQFPSWVKSVKIFPTSHERPGLEAGAYLQWRYDYDQFEKFDEAVQKIGLTLFLNYLKGDLSGNDAFKQKVNDAISEFKKFDFYLTYAFEIEIEEGQLGSQFAEEDDDASIGLVGDLFGNQGAFESEEDLSGTPYDPFIDADIYALIEKDGSKWEDDIPNTTPSGATHYINFNPNAAKKVPLNLYPSLQNDAAVTVSGVSVTLERLQHVIVTKEWVTGTPSFAEVQLLDGEMGYIPSALLYPITSIKPTILEKSIIKPGPSKSIMAQVLVPPWQRNKKPYFYSERSEWWVTTTLPYTCVLDEGDLQNKKLEAVPIAVQRLLDYRNKSFNEEEVSKITNGFLGATADDVYLSTRPGSRLKVLVKIPSVYVEAVPVDVDQSRLGYDEETDQTNFVIDHERDGVRVKVGELESSLRKALKAMVKFNKEYAMSDYYVEGFSFYKEIRRLATIPALVKGLLSDNNLSYSDLIAKGASDPCGDIDDVINTLDFEFSIEDIPQGEGNCPDDDKVVVLASVIYNSTEAPPANTSDPEMRRISLLKGFSDILESKVFSSPRTTALFLYHQNFSDPGLDWRTFIEKYCYDCKPKIVPRGKSYTNMPVPQNNSNCAGDTKNDPNMMFDIPQVSFEDLFKKVALNFNKNLELDEDSQIMPNLDLEFDLNFNLDFKGGMLSQRNSMSSFTGDWFTSVGGLQDIEFNIGNGGLDSLYNFVLKHIDFGKLFGSLGSYYISAGGFSSGGDFGSSEGGWRRRFRRH